MKILKHSLLAAGLLALFAAPAFGYEAGTLVLRGGVGNVDPKSNNFSYSYSDAEGSFDARISVADSSSMTLTGTYMINQNWAIDLMAALPFKHDVDFTMDIEIPDVLEPTHLTGKLGDTKQLPPTLSLQYHFRPDADFQPYAGVGMNWTTFSSTHFRPRVDGVEGADLLILDQIDKMYLDDSFGVAAQLGGDWAIGDRAVLNIDVRWIDIDTDISMSGPGFEGKEKLGTLEIDPWVYSLNLGYRF